MSLIVTHRQPGEYYRHTESKKHSKNTNRDRERERSQTGVQVHKESESYLTRELRGKDFGQSLANSMHGRDHGKGSEEQLGPLAEVMLPRPQTDPNSP